jgi:hypothetical protein
MKMSDGEEKQKQRGSREDNENFKRGRKFHLSTTMKIDNMFACFLAPVILQ